MPDQPQPPVRGWLPVLDADQRMGSADPVNEPDHNALPIAEGSPGDPERRGARSNRLTHDWSAALEAQFGLIALGESSSESGATEVDTHRELTDFEMIQVLRDRLAYYEHFDSLIRDNVSRSADLFQAVFTERERVRISHIPVDVSAEIDRRMQAERIHTQHILMSLMDEATFLQQRADSLIQRLAEAITEMSAYRSEDDEPVSGA